VYNRQQAAARAGVTTEELNRVVELGIIDPGEGDKFTSGDVRRTAMVHSLEEAGVSLEGLAVTMARGDLSLAFMDSEAYDRFPSLTPVTFQELSEQSGVPVELLMLVREASGFAQPTPEDRVRDSELAVVPFLQIQITEGFRPVAIERLLRSMGDNLRRIAASEADWWRSEVMEPRLDAGLTSDRAVGAEFTDRITPLAEQTMLTLYHAQQAQAWTRNILDGFEESLIRAGLHNRLDRPPAMCFLDITGYTHLTQEHGDAAAAKLADVLARLVQRSSSKHDGRPVKWLGDGVMIWFRDPGPGVIAALDMVDGVKEAGLPPAHVGLHAGPVIFQEGDYYGQTVNLASRIADYARPGEVLVSQEVVNASADVGASFTEIGPVELKGVSGTIHLHSARRGADS
jgi:adenylate cyclase